MKKFPKVFTSILSALFLFGLLVQNTTHASDNLSEDELLNGVRISVTNDQTGEVTYLDPMDSKNKMKVLSIKSNDGSVEVGYEVFVPLEDLNAPVITPFDTDGSSKTSGGITAKLYVDYDTNASNEKVRLNRVYGSWQPTDNSYYVTDRKVDAHSGAGTGKTLSKTPTSNSFSYTTGWDYNYRVGGQAAPRAWSSAKGHVAGMTGTSHTIKIEFTYADL